MIVFGLLIEREERDLHLRLTRDVTAPRSRALGHAAEALV
jgi:hypothetical protein